MARQRTVSDEGSTAVMDEPEVMKMNSPVRIGDIVIFRARGGAEQPAIATGNENDGKLDLTALPRGLNPVPYMMVECDSDGAKDFTWRRR